MVSLGKLKLLLLDDRSYADECGYVVEDLGGCSLEILRPALGKVEQN